MGDIRLLLTTRPGTCAIPINGLHQADVPRSVIRMKVSCGQGISVDLDNVDMHFGVKKICMKVTQPTEQGKCPGTLPAALFMEGGGSGTYARALSAKHLDQDHPILLEISHS